MNKEESADAPDISVITPVYNAEKFVAETIDSILNQTYRNFEFLIFDDKSTDRTIAVIERYAKKDLRIKLFRNDRNYGQVITRNLALKKARGKYIAITDHDDISLPERFESQYDFLEKHPDVFLVASGAARIDDAGGVVDSLLPPTESAAIEKQLAEKNIFIHSSVMYRNQPGLRYRSKMHFVDDYDFLLRNITAGKKFASLPQTLVKYRSGANTQTLKNLGKVEMFADMAREFYRERQKNSKDSYEQFNPKNIIDIDPENTDNKTILKGEIQAAFRLNNFSKVRKYCLKYFNYYGYFNKLFIYYLASYLPGSMISGLRRKKTA